MFNNPFNFRGRGPRQPLLGTPARTKGPLSLPQSPMLGTPAIAQDPASLPMQPQAPLPAQPLALGGLSGLDNKQQAVDGNTSLGASELLKARTKGPYGF